LFVWNSGCLYHSIRRTVKRWTENWVGRGNMYRKKIRIPSCVSNEGCPVCNPRASKPNTVVMNFGLKLPLPLNWDKWRAVVTTIMNLQVP
jgi:hypothetical protein